MQVKRVGTTFFSGKKRPGQNILHCVNTLCALNLSSRSSPPLAVHLHAQSELAAGQGFLILLTHVPPTPRRFKAVELPNQTPTSLKIAKTTRSFQSYLSSERSTRSSTILKLINYSTSKTQPPPPRPPLPLPFIHSPVHCDLFLDKGITETYSTRDWENFRLFLSAPFFLPSSFPQTSNIKALFDASSDSLYIRDVSQSPGLRAAI